MLCYHRSLRGVSLCRQIDQWHFKLPKISGRHLWSELFQPKELIEWGPDYAFIYSNPSRPCCRQTIPHGTGGTWQLLQEESLHLFNCYTCMDVCTEFTLQTADNLIDSWRVCANSIISEDQYQEPMSGHWWEWRAMGWLRGMLLSPRWYKLKWETFIHNTSSAHKIKMYKLRQFSQTVT